VEVYRFFRDQLGARFLQFIPIVERVSEAELSLANQGWGERRQDGRPLYTQSGNLVTDRSVDALAFGRFNVDIFEEWVRRDVGTVYVQTFDSTLGAHVGQYSLCIFSPTCGTALTVERNGDLYSCDHYVEPDYLLGNIKSEHMLDLITSPKQRAFGQDKQDTLPRYCIECDVRGACNGGCPRERFIDTPDGDPGPNYLCAGYKEFFGHVDQPMRRMAQLLRENRFADEIMAEYAAADAQRPRNGPCTCGNSRKWKSCHGSRVDSSARPRLGTGLDH
jgi:uncharacterized protein